MCSLSMSERGAFRLGKAGGELNEHDQRIKPCFQREINKMAMSLEQRELCLVKQVSWGVGGVIPCVWCVSEGMQRMCLCTTHL